MAAFRSKLPAATAASALMLLALGGCTGPVEAPSVRSAPPGFSADTFSREGLISGATATEEGCRALPDGLWASADRGERQECIRFAAAGTERPARTAVVYIPGDPGGVSYRFAGGRPYVEHVSEYYELSPETRRAGVEALSGAMGGLPVINMARPGMHGSSGNHALDRHSQAEVELLDDALTQIRKRFGFAEFVIAGFSSGGTITANLLARRTDIRCAVIASAPLDLAGYYRRDDGTALDYYNMRSGDLADPMDSLRTIRSDATVFVFGDQGDRNVPASSWGAWVDAARRAGLHVYAAEVPGLERPELGGNVASRHHTSSYAMEVSYACAKDVPAAQVLQALRLGRPILVPRGRRLSGAEIRAAFAGQSLRATEWYPRVNISSRWGTDGTLSYFDVGHGEERIAILRWWVEGDRLCTTRHGCGDVFAEGRFLHVVRGNPPRLRVTFVMPPPRG